MSDHFVVRWYIDTQYHAESFILDPRYTLCMKEIYKTFIQSKGLLHIIYEFIKPKLNLPLHSCVLGDVKDTTNIRLLHRFCENEKSRYLYVTDRAILITFVTNSLRQATGFKFNIRIIPLSRMYIS